MRRGKAAGLSRRSLQGGIAVAIVALGIHTSASAQMNATQWLATTTAGHDVIANCLAQAMAAVLTGSPVVSPPPRKTAYVNFRPRANPPIDPVARFHVEPGPGGAMRIGWQRLADSPAGARWDASAKAAASRCATPGQ
jgi:hypothetical protein